MVEDLALQFAEVDALSDRMMSEISIFISIPTSLCHLHTLSVIDHGVGTPVDDYSDLLQPIFLQIEQNYLITFIYPAVPGVMQGFHKFDNLLLIVHF